VTLVHNSFNKCASLTSITFEGMCPIFVTEGSAGMFTGLPADCVIYVPDNQVSAYKAAFADREDVVARIKPSGKNAERIDRTAPESDFVFDASTGTITGYTGSAHYLVIPASIDGVQVKHIADEAFLWCHTLYCVVLPEGIETIGAYGFAGIELLNYVSLPSTLTFIDEGAFSSSYMCAISYNAASMPAYDASAFDGIKSKIWELILPYGSAPEFVDSFASYMAASAHKAVVKSSIIEPYSFPKLDAEAGAAFIGKWNGVAVFDGTDTYGMDLLGMSVIVELLDDGTGALAMDTENTPGGWYMENGTAIFAPIPEEGGEPMPEEAVPFTLDENGRMLIDFGGIILLMEQEGKEYTVPAIAEKPWPELDAEKAKSYIGTWDAVSYIVDGETFPAELVGSMTLILSDDGTARMLEGEEEEPYELNWYAEFYSAYVGPTMSAAVEIFFDMNGNLQMLQDGAKVVFAPHADAKVIEGADELLGDWLDDIGNKLSITNDGVLTYTYASDGWVDTYAWDVVNGDAVITEGLWEGASIYMNDGIVFIDNDEGIFQLFSADGDLSSYYGDDDDMPEAQPVGAEGEPYFGTWKTDMYGIEVLLIMNPDGTCAMEMFGESEPGVWSVINGKADIMGDELYINDDGNLVYDAQFMVFTKVEEENDGEEMSDEELMAFLALLEQMSGNESTELPEHLQAYVGTWHMVYMAGGTLEGDLRPMGITAKLELNADGTGKLSGVTDDSGNWYEDEGIVRFGQGDSPLTLLDGGFLRYGSQLAGYIIFSQDASAVWSPEPEVPALPAEPVITTPAIEPIPSAGDIAYVGQKFVCKTYTTFGQTMDASMLGAEYGLLFHENSTADFTMAGFTVPSLPYTITNEGVYSINYYGTAFNCTPTASGFDMDYYGTMTMHFVPVE